MEKADKVRSALSSALSYLQEKSPTIIGAAGGLLFIIGFFSIPPFSFSLEAAIEVLMGGALITVAFSIHSRSYFSGTATDKAYALSIVSIIALLTTGIILYSFSNAETVYMGIELVMIGRVGIREPAYAIVADHIYQQFSIYAFIFAIASAVIAVYLRTKVD